MENQEIARLLDEVADLLALSKANPFRVRAYREGANAIRQLERPAADILATEGTAGLERLEHIGRGLAGAIRSLVETGSLRTLDELRAEVTPELVLEELGVGPELAARIVGELGLSTVAELEAAAAEGRLERVPGIDRRMAGAVREQLEARLGRPLQPPGVEQPPVEELLDVDREYRAKAGAGELFTIAPKRFNPKGEAWLPVLHTKRGQRRYTALFSNTKLAHELGKTRDWVVLYYARPGEREAQATVVTETGGDLAGRRVVRGRERETSELYAREREMARA